MRSIVFGAVGALAFVLGSVGPAAAGSNFGVSLHLGGLGPHDGHGVVHIGSRHGHHRGHGHFRGPRAHHRYGRHPYSHSYASGGYRYAPHVRYRYGNAPRYHDDYHYHDDGRRYRGRDCY